MMVLAQSVPVPIDVSDIVKLGPGYALAVYMIFLWGKERDRNDKLIDAHKIEMAAMLARADKTTSDRIEDHKVLIPLASALTQRISAVADK